MNRRQFIKGLVRVSPLLFVPPAVIFDMGRDNFYRKPWIYIDPKVIQLLNEFPHPLDDPPPIMIKSEWVDAMKIKVIKHDKVFIDPADKMSFGLKRPAPYTFEFIPGAG